MKFYAKLKMMRAWINKKSISISFSLFLILTTVALLFYGARNVAAQFNECTGPQPQECADAGGCCLTPDACDGAGGNATPGLGCFRSICCVADPDVPTPTPDQPYPGCGPTTNACAGSGGCCLNADTCRAEGGFDHGSLGCTVANVTCCSPTAPTPTPTPIPLGCVDPFECVSLSNATSCGDGDLSYPQHCETPDGSIGNCCVSNQPVRSLCKADPPDGYGGRCDFLCGRNETKVDLLFDDCTGALANAPCCVPDQQVVDCNNNLKGRCLPFCPNELGLKQVGNRGDFNCHSNNYVDLQVCCVFDIGELGDVTVNTPLGGSCPDDELDTAIGCIPLSSDQAVLEFFLSWAIGIAGGIAFILIVYAGYMIIASQGDPKRIQAGKELLTAAIAGIAFLVLSVIMLRFIGVTVLRIPWR